MSIEVKNNKKINSIDKESGKKIYHTLEENFTKHYYDFDYPKNFENDIWNYYSVLSTYLKNQGYGYASKLVDEHISNKKIDELELARVFMDCNLIKKYNKFFRTNIKNKHKFEYNIMDGLSKDFFIEYENNVTLKIKKVIYNNKDFICHEIDKENQRIYFKVNIQPNENINFTEIISVETTYGVDKLEFTIQCKIEQDNEGLFRNMDEFFDLCQADIKTGLGIFKSDEFKKYLKYKKYSTQLINYDKAILMGNGNFNNTLKYFCMLNNVCINDTAIKNKTYTNKIEEKSLKEREAMGIKSKEKNTQFNDDSNKKEDSTKGKTFKEKLKSFFRRDKRK